VSALFAVGAFGIFWWATHHGLDVETARTMVVNTIVVMSIAYLFTVRYLRSASLSWRGVLGTPAVLLGVGGVTALQLAFTYAPFMNTVFETRAVPLVPGLAIILVGVALFIILEVEKRVQERYGALIERSLLWPRRALGSLRSMQRAAARFRRRLG
jgi:magnesium-transporting ATPase (P-type)